MIRLFFLLSTSISLLLAISLTELQELYDKEAYPSVIENARASTQLYDQVKLHLLWAKSAQKTGALQSAMSAYERVLIIDPYNQEAQIALVHLYHELQRDMLAKELHSNLLKQQLSPQQRLRAMVLLGIGYDSNIGTYSDFEQDEGTNDDISDTLYSHFQAALNYTYFFENNRDWFFQADGSLQAQNNFDASYYDFYSPKASMGIGYRSEAMTIYAPLVYEYLYYLERSLYMSYGSEPYVNVALSESAFFQLSGKYIQRRFIKAEDQMMDDDIAGGGAALIYTDEIFFAYVRVMFDRYSAVDDKGARYIDKQALSTKLGAALSLGLWQSRIDYLYRSMNFDDDVLSKDEKRKDDSHQIALDLSYLFHKEWRSGVAYSYIQNSSNDEQAKYNKQTAMLYVRYGF